MGYEAYREAVLERQKKLGIVPESAELSPINPYVDDEEPRRQAVVPARHRAAVGVAVRRREAALLADGGGLRRLPEPRRPRSSAACSTTSSDSGQLDNTLIVLVSDNGASGEGGPNGSVNENKFFNGLPDTIEENLKQLDELGSPRTYNHYPTGWAWAFNTPFKLWKRYSNYRGGTADPLIVSWPKGIESAGEIRRAVRHAVDIVPTLYECLGIELPDEVNGYTQKPIEGVSFAYSLDACRRADAQGDAVLLDARHARDLAQGLEGRDRRSGRARVVGRLPPAEVGAVRHRGRPERVQRPLRDASGQAPGADRALVGRGRRASGAAARVADGASRSSARSGRSSRSRGRATSTTRAAPRSRSRSPRTSATARTRSPPSARSRRRRPAASSSRRDRASAATPSTSAAAS